MTLAPSYTRIDRNIFVVTGDMSDGNGCMAFYMIGSTACPSMSYLLWFF
jgi:hypothetical protein